MDNQNQPVNNQLPPQGQYQMPQGQYQMPQGQYQMPQAEVDDLSTAGVVFTWLGVIFGGCIGLLVISILYYAMKGKTPKKAAKMNKHSWIAFLVTLLLWAVFYALVGAAGATLV